MDDAAESERSSKRIVPLNRATIELLEHAPSMVVATSSDDLMPDLVQAVGCRVLADGRVVLIVSREQGEGVIECLEAGRGLAASFSDPRTLRTVQIKADRAVVSPARRVDLEAVRRYREAFAIELASVGFAAAYGAAITDTGDGELVAITAAPTAVFEQTPGPSAGTVIDGAKVSK